MTKTFIYPLQLLLLLLLIGCGPSEATRREEVETSMKSWVGRSENELVEKWGAPSRSYKLTDGSRELSWFHTFSSSSPGYTWTDARGRVYYSHPAKHQKKIERSFTIDKSGTIIAYQWEGL
jgi:hypothetical protein